MSYIDPQSLARISMSVAGNALTIGVKQPFRCWVPDASNPGSNIEKVITAPAAINMDGHASENFNTGSTGQTLANAWGSNYPLYWYWTFFDGTVYWVASRNSCMKVMPAAAQIGDFDAAPAGTQAQGDAFVAASITEADFAGLPVWGPIGSMPVTRAAASEIPTAVALTAGQDGFGKFQEGVQFTMPLGQNGAQAGEYFSETAAGDMPDWTTEASILARYTLNRHGQCRFLFSTYPAGNITDNGSNANALWIHTPYTILASETRVLGNAITNLNATPKEAHAAGVGGTSYLQVVIDSTSVAANAFANAADDIGLEITYAAF